MKTVLLTNLQNAFEHRLAEAFVGNNYGVYAMVASGDRSGDKDELTGIQLLPDDLAAAHAELEKRAGKIDIYIDVSDYRDGRDCFTVREGLDESILREVYEANVLRPMAALEAFLPLLDAGEGKRLCFLTAAEASINETRGVSGYGYKMSKAALHNFFQMIANKLTPAGYTLRVYDPMADEVGPTEAAGGAYHYFTRRRGTEREDPLRDDETRWVFRDALGREHSW